MFALPRLNLVRIATMAFLGFMLFVAPQTVSALTVSPLQHTLILDPGAQQIVGIDVTNDADDPIELRGVVDAFVVDSESGRPRFGANDPARLWIDPPKDTALLAPNQTVRLQFVVSVPEHATPGSHYLALFAEQRGQGGQVAVSSRLGTLLFLSVAGEIEESLTRQSFAASQDVYTAGPVSVTLALENTGTYQVLPIGEITATNMAGRQIAALPMNREERTIFAGMQWQENFEIDTLTWKDVGPITVRARIQYGVSSQQLTAATTVWYIPRAVVGIVVGVLLLIVAFVLGARRGARKYKKKYE